ncbi:MAG TPA: type II secretion system minor pseudopilin GspK [Xanthomonadales bacterium]|nr:type II secretion system minor pseudopilin GspK [Xanthomonadales bacterium]
MIASRTQRGTALLIVLWVVALLGILLGSFVVLARSEQLQTRYLFDSTRARYAAEAGVSRAIYEMRRADPMTKWVPDGRTYEVDFDDAKLEIAITDESGKIDINMADELMLLALFHQAGADDERATKLVDAVMDWRDPDDLVRPFGAEDDDYEAAGLGYGAADHGFALAGELQQVLGMDYELFRKVAPMITVYARTARPNPAYASPEVLALLPGMTPDIASQFVEQRRLTPPDQLAATPLMLPDGTPVTMGGGGLTYTVQSRATLPNGAWTVLDTTVRIGGTPGGRAYSILRWREGSAD